jgi:hypothetical protein
MCRSPGRLASRVEVDDASDRYDNDKQHADLDQKAEGQYLDRQQDEGEKRPQHERYHLEEASNDREKHAKHVGTVSPRNQARRLRQGLRVPLYEFPDRSEVLVHADQHQVVVPCVGYAQQRLVR